ncbi:MAG TPA: hypothetical protein VKY65_15280 [Alphaproteobacteria bacterium]|nr:hypothetical protein [Alphaproteobacteria bacterium]
MWRSAPEPYDSSMRDFLDVGLAAILLSLGAAGVAAAGDDHERARAALEAGEIRPLKEIVGNVQSRCGGKVIEVELEQSSRNGRQFWLYELRMMMPKGDVLRLDIDASTTEILQVKGRGADSACR